MARQPLSEIDPEMELHLLSSNGQDMIPTVMNIPITTHEMDYELPRPFNSANADGDEDEDEGDDGVDQVIESRRQLSTGERSMESDTISWSNLERPQHAHLSPRSAAVLSNTLSTQGSSLSQTLVDSSVFSVLNALSQQITGYENNPYFRRLDFTPQQHEAESSSLHGISVREGLFEASRQGPIIATTTVPTPLPVHNEIYRRNARGYEGCGERSLAIGIEARGDVWPLNFEMYYADGGEFNSAHSVENVLKNDSSVYCSRRSANINICLKLAEPHQTCVLTQFKAKSPTTGFTAPCKEGLIFVSHEPIALEKTTFFDDMTRERYDEYMENLYRGQGFEQLLRRHGADADALVPAGFFQMDGPDETSILNLIPNRSCRYVLIKLLRSRCTNSLQRPENIDLQYLGMIGYTGARSFASGSLL
ncbi:hypothetical protein BGX34_004087 [Mortierella sp. NVP85]|nr:hypothetical protein BGX34_004087 [Mortierella sp. NVP85]